MILGISLRRIAMHKMTANIPDGVRGLVVRWLRCIYCTKVLSLLRSHYPAGTVSTDTVKNLALNGDSYVFWVLLESSVLVNLQGCGFARAWQEGRGQKAEVGGE